MISLQEKVVFVTCEDDEKVSDIERLAGKYVRLWCLLFSWYCVRFSFTFIPFSSSLPPLNVCLSLSFFFFGFSSLSFFFLGFHLSFFSPLFLLAKRLCIIWSDVLIVNAFVKLCRLEASSTCVNLNPYITHGNDGNFGLKTLSGSSSSTVLDRGVHVSSFSASKAPMLSQARIFFAPSL